MSTAALLAWRGAVRGVCEWAVCHSKLRVESTALLACFLPPPPPPSLASHSTACERLRFPLPHWQAQGVRTLATPQGRRAIISRKSTGANKSQNRGLLDVCQAGERPAPPPQPIGGPKASICDSPSCACPPAPLQGQPRALRPPLLCDAGGKWRAVWLGRAAGRVCGRQLLKPQPGVPLASLWHSLVCFPCSGRR